MILDSFWLGYVWLGWLVLMSFLVGSMIGSFLNVCIARLPRGKSLLFPGSHCGACGKAIGLRDNIPLLSYWLLGGRCRACGVTFTLRYFWVELALAVGFVAVFVFDIVCNVNRINSFGTSGFGYLVWMRYPPGAGWFFALRVLMLAWLATCFCIGLEQHKVPVSVWLSGLLLALVSGGVCPWPWPDSVGQAVAPAGQLRQALPADLPIPRDDPTRWLKAWPRATMVDDATKPWSEAPACPRSGLQPWPVWGPLPEWLPAGNARLGLGTTVAGALAGAMLGMVLAGLGVKGFAPLLALAGAYLGWQPLVVVVGAIGVGFVVGLPIALLRCQGIFSQMPGFVGLGVVVAWFGWPWLGPLLYRYLFDPWVALSLCGGLMLAWFVVVLKISGRNWT